MILYYTSKDQRYLLKAKSRFGMEKMAFMKMAQDQFIET